MHAAVLVGASNGGFQFIRQVVVDGVHHFRPVERYSANAAILFEHHLCHHESSVRSFLDL